MCAYFAHCSLFEQFSGGFYDSDVSEVQFKMNKSISDRRTDVAYSATTYSNTLT